MFDQLKNIKIYHAFLIAFAISILCVVFKSSEIYTDNSLVYSIDFSIAFFILSGITYKFRDITTIKNASTAKKIHIAGMVIFSLFVFLFFSDKITWQDDKVFETYLDNTSLKTYLLIRYNEWTSRYIIETILLALVNSNIYVWRLLTTILVTIIVECTIELFLSQDTKKYSFLVQILALLAIPYLSLCDAGWIATTTNYLWPLAAFMPLCLTLRKIFEKKEIDVFEKIQACILTLIATNIEPLVLCVLGLCITLFFYNAYATKETIKELWSKLDKTFLLIIVISFCSLLLTLLAPGNGYRVISATQICYPEFASFSLIDKIELSFVSTMPFFYANMIYASNLAYPTNFVMLLLMLFTCIRLWQNKQTKILLLNILGILVVLYNQVHILALTFGKQITPHWYILANAKIGQQSDFNGTFIFLEIVIYLFILITLFYGVFQALNKGSKALLACIILLAGFCTRFVMGFSPTVYASGTRTFLFTIVSILIVTIMMINELTNNEKSRKVTFVFFATSMLYIYALTPRITTGTESERKTESVDISKLDIPLHENNEIKKAFKIDINNNTIQAENDDTLICDAEQGMAMTGWAYDIESKESLDNLYIIVGDKCVKASYGYERPDVANARKVSKKVGWSLNLSSDLFFQNGSEVKEIAFILVNSSNNFKYPAITYKVRYKNVKVEEINIPQERWEAGFRIEVCNDKQLTDGDKVLNLDKFKGLDIYGWALDIAHMTKLNNIQVIVGDTIINASYGGDRKDVADFFKMSDKDLGFKVEIPAEVINKRKNITDIGFVLITQNSDLKCKPIIYKINR